MTQTTYTARSLDVVLSSLPAGEAPTVWWHTGGTLAGVAELVGC